MIIADLGVLGHGTHVAGTAENEHYDDKITMTKDNLGSIEIPDSVKTIGLSNFLDLDIP